MRAGVDREARAPAAAAAAPLRDSSAHVELVGEQRRAARSRRASGADDQHAAGRAGS